MNTIESITRKVGDNALLTINGVLHPITVRVDGQVGKYLKNGLQDTFGDTKENEVQCYFYATGSAKKSTEQIFLLVHSTSDRVNKKALLSALKLRNQLLEAEKNSQEFNSYVDYYEVEDESKNPVYILAFKKNHAGVLNLNGPEDFEDIWQKLRAEQFDYTATVSLLPPAAFVLFLGVCFSMSAINCAGGAAVAGLSVAASVGLFAGLAAVAAIVLVGFAVFYFYDKKQHAKPSVSSNIIFSTKKGAPADNNITESGAAPRCS